MTRHEFGVNVVWIPINNELEGSGGIDTRCLVSDGAEGGAGSFAELKKARAQDGNEPEACVFGRDTEHRWSRKCLSPQKLIMIERPQEAVRYSLRQHIW